MASISFPSAVEPREVVVTREKTAQATYSPYTFSRQVFRHPGDRYVASFSYPPLASADANTVLTFLENLDGQVNTTQVNLSSYTPHTNVSNLTMALIDNSYSYRKTVAGHYIVSFELGEVISE